MPVTSPLDFMFRENFNHPSRVYRLTGLRLCHKADKPRNTLQGLSINLFYECILIFEVGRFTALTRVKPLSAEEAEEEDTVPSRRAGAVLYRYLPTSRRKGSPSTPYGSLRVWPWKIGVVPSS